MSTQQRMDDYLAALEELELSPNLNALLVQDSVDLYRRQYRRKLDLCRIATVGGFILFALWLHVAPAWLNPPAFLIWLGVTVWSLVNWLRYEARW